MDPALSSTVQMKLGSTLQKAIHNYINNISAKFNTTVNPLNSPIDIKNLTVYAGVCYSINLFCLAHVVA
jgi:hypothetical protein